MRLATYTLSAVLIVSMLVTPIYAAQAQSSGSNTTAAVVGGVVAGGAILAAFLAASTASGAARTAAATAAAEAQTSALSTAVLAAQAKGVSFGGRIAALLPCVSYLGPSMWVTIVPAPFTKQPLYIWTPETLRGVPPTPDLPPPFAPLQQILGIADIPYFCCLPPSIPTIPFTCQIPAYPYWIPVPPLLGQRMQFANQSLLPSPPGAVEVILLETAAEAAAATAAASAASTVSAESVKASIMAGLTAALTGAAAAASPSPKN